MNKGGQLIGIAAILTLAACAEQGKLELRSLPSKLAEGERPVPFRVLEGRGQLRLGNVALALESFRKALREDAGSVEALAGIAACYDLMGRFDLSRRHYEAALAITPRDPQLLTSFATSLDLQGLGTEAVSVRREIHQLTAARATPREAPQVALQAIAAAPAQPSPVVQAAPPPQAAAIEPRSVQATEARGIPPVRPSPPQASTATKPKVPAAAIAGTSPLASRSVTVSLPPARPVDVAVALPAASPTAAPKVAERRAPARSKAASQSTPAPARTRLERTSLHEVALITRQEPKWRPLLVARSEQSATVRFVPLRQSRARTASVRLLNAARVNALAARTRDYLTDRGWRSVSIGDASSVRPSSIILYPAGRRRTAETLSAQFGFAIAQRRGTGPVLVLLGRDAARVAALRAKG